MERDALERRVGVGLRDLRALYRSREIFFNRRAAAPVRSFIDVVEQHAMTGGGADLRDARSHLTGPDHKNRHPSPTTTQKKGRHLGGRRAVCSVRRNLS